MDSVRIPSLFDIDLEALKSMIEFNSIQGRTGRLQMESKNTEDGLGFNMIHQRWIMLSP